MYLLIYVFGWPFRWLTRSFVVATLLVCVPAIADSSSPNAPSSGSPPAIDPVSASREMPLGDSILPPVNSPAVPDIMNVQIDPLNSPYPVPWNWFIAMLSENRSVNAPRFRYYRSPSLISPNGQYAAYSRIQVQLSNEPMQSRVASVLFIENLKTGDLQTITAASPFADNPFMGDAEPDEAGRIAMLIPVAWSQSGDRVLAREFESIFGSDIASDFAVIWERDTNHAYTIAPTQVEYSNAVLLGWSQTYPDRVLFQAGNLGDETWPLYAVDTKGDTAYSAQDQPLVFGQVVNNVWAGPQAYVKQ